MYHWFPCFSVFCLVPSYDVLVNMHFQALTIACMGLHYHSQMWYNTFHEMMIISVAFGGYIVILVGILTDIFTGYLVFNRRVRTFIFSWVSLPVYSVQRESSCTLNILVTIFKHCQNYVLIFLASTLHI